MQGMSLNLHVLNSDYSIFLYIFLFYEFFLFFYSTKPFYEELAMYLCLDKNYNFKFY